MRNVTKIPTAAESAPQFRTNRAHPLERSHHRRLFLSIGLLLCFTSLAFGEGQVTQNFAMPVQVHAAVGFSNCSNSPGPQITLDGSISLGGLNVDLIFRNNLKGTHTYTDQQSVEVVAVPAGGTLVIPKQPPLGGVGGNPFIWVQFLDGDGYALSPEIYLGRCVQGPVNVDPDLAAYVEAVANFEALDCSNNPGPYITVDCSMSFPKGVNAQLIFRNNANPVGGPHEAIRSAYVSIIPAGFTLTIPKQPVLGGVGGNPWIFTRFEQADGIPIGDEVLLGRCVELGKAN